jgi:TolB-like protein/tRNA A-37 threonylcarbamoyl transferase component Bud32/Flp pilus assembly protein TadD
VRDHAEELERLRAALASRYRIVREVGRGGMATVYLAEDLKHDRRVAVKVLRPELAPALGPERFLREIQIAAVLAHPHILPLHDSGEADGFVYYVMPYLEGETLRDRLVRQRQLPIREAVRIVQEVADGLGYAHSLGVVHRDIKPENILFMGGHAVVADFGVATAVGAAGGTRLTESGLSVGTPVYMSPEQALGQADIDGRSDTYSLGCVLYEMLTGDPPFDASNPQAVLAKKLSEPVPRLASLRETVSPALEEAVLRALSRIPADRFATPVDFASAAANGWGSDMPADLSAGRVRRPGVRDDARSRVTRAVLLLVGLLAVALVWTVWPLRVGDGGGTAKRPAGPLDGDAQRQATIGVLPFENLGPADDEYFAAGMTDEITNRLGAVSGLGLVPRRAAQRYSRTDMTMREIGRELGIDYLLVGSVRWAGSRGRSRSVRITLELLRAQDERQIWSTTYDRVIDDIFEVQSDIAGQVIERLGVTLREGERSRLRTQPTENHEAYTLYLKGRYFWNKRTEESIQTGLDYFQQAVDLDPGYSLAWAGIADAWIFRGWYGRLAPRETYPKAKHAAIRALEFDSTLAEAHLSLAHIHFQFDHDWDAAERGYRRAIALNPMHPIVHHWYGGSLSAMGRHEEALQHAETARALDPLSLIIQTWVGLRYYFAGKYEDAIAEYLKALELDSDFAPAHWHLGWAYEQTGRFAEGVSEAERALAIDGGNLLYLASLGRAYAKAGMEKEARATLARLAQASTSRHVSAYHVAVIYIALGDTTAGLDWLERAYDEQSPWIGYLRVDPRVDPVRSHPRFESLLGKTRLRF